MASKQEILSHFQLYNMKPNDEVLNKCVELCTVYNVDPEDFVDMWCAYTASNLAGAPPSLDALDKMERKEFKNQNKELSVSNLGIVTPKTPKAKATSAIAEPINLDPIDSALKEIASAAELQEPEKIINDPTPTNRVPIPGYIQQRNTQQDSICDESLSISQTSYSVRKDSLSVCCSYGMSASFRRQCDILLDIKLHGNEDLPHNGLYMYEIMHAKAIALNKMTNQIGQTIMEKNNLELTQESIKEYTGEMITCGRICSEGLEKLDSQSLLLESTMELSNGHAVKLATNKLSNYTFFPGQTVVVKGNNIQGNVFYAETIYANGAPDSVPKLPAISEPLEIVVAAGPFTLQNNLLYEPLADLVKYVLEFQPHVLILLGPFLESTHPGIHNGELQTDFDDLFEQLLERIAVPLAKSGVQIVIVSSQRDAHHHKVYPTPPYASRENYANIMFVPDPCMLSINGLIVGVTSADILFHMGKRELCVDKSRNRSDRFARLASYVLQQQSFYPLYPPDKDMAIDHNLLLNHGMIDCIPHVLILPSNFRSFIKNVNECVVINPERLARGFVAGSFARIEVSPIEENEQITKQIASQVLKI